MKETGDKMAVSKNLKSIITRQREVLAELEKEEARLSQSDLVNENDQLKKELAALKLELAGGQEKITLLTNENERLKNSLYEQIMNEKNAILQVTNQKVDIYFKSDVVGEKNRLYRFEHRAKARMVAMMGTLKRCNVADQQELQEKIEALAQLLDEKLAMARAELHRSYQMFSKEELAEIERMKSEPVDEEMIRAIEKKNNIETFLGLNVLNKVGILFLIIGVIAASRFAYTQVPDVLKGSLFFVLGTLMLISGEWLNRKKPSVFSLGITSGGVAVLYAAVALSYFQLEILTMYPALLVCMVVTGLAFVLSRHYQSQVIATFALIGGYLPILSIEGNLVVAYGAMVYFVILNLFAMLLAVNRKWTITHIVGFTLNVLGTIYVVLCVMALSVPGFSVPLRNAVTIAYILFTFAIYTLIPMVSTLKNRLKFMTVDYWLLGLNTAISALVMYGFFYSIGFESYTGVLALAFAGLYFILGRFVHLRMPDDAVVRILFHVTGLTFAVLFVPLQLELRWLTLGWLAQGVGLSTFAILKNQKRLTLAGLIISALAAYTFFGNDVLAGNLWLTETPNLFPYKYFALTLGSCLILAAFLYKKPTVYLNFVTVYKYFVTVNLFFYLWYIIDKMNLILFKGADLAGLNSTYLSFSLMIVATFVLAYLLPRVKVLADNGMVIVAGVFNAVALLSLLMVTIAVSYLDVARAVASLPVLFFGTVLLGVTNLLAVLALRDSILWLVRKLNLAIQSYPIVVSGYFVGMLTLNLICQYDLAFTSATISMIYIVTAFLWIWFGFVKRYAYMRRFGLGLSVLAIAKLFLLDMFRLSQGNKIVSYFVFGVVLLAISFVYQSFVKRFEEKNSKSENEGGG